MARILIVEDDAKNMKLFRDLLRVGGHTALEATDGQQGVEMVRQEKPDLVLMDIQMPVMDGLKATRILKADAETKDIPVVALTALAMEGDKERMLEAGCDWYITKPFQVKDFLTRITEFLAQGE